MDLVGLAHGEEDLWLVFLPLTPIIRAKPMFVRPCTPFAEMATFAQQPQ